MDLFLTLLIIKLFYLDPMSECHKDIPAINCHVEMSKIIHQIDISDFFVLNFLKLADLPVINKNPNSPASLFLHLTSIVSNYKLHCSKNFSSQKCFPIHKKISYKFSSQKYLVEQTGVSSSN